MGYFKSQFIFQKWTQVSFHIRKFSGGPSLNSALTCRVFSILIHKMFWTSSDLWINHFLFITDWILTVLDHSLDTRVTKTPSQHCFVFFSFPLPNWSIYCLVTIALVNNNKLSHSHSGCDWLFCCLCHTRILLKTNGGHISSIFKDSDVLQSCINLSKAARASINYID